MINGTCGRRYLHRTWDAFADRDQLTTAELIGRLVNDEESPWVGRTWAAPGETVLTPRMLAFLLRGFGPRPVNIRHHGDQAKGYRRVDFADAWSRYLPPPPGSAICLYRALRLRAEPTSHVRRVADCEGHHLLNGPRS
jgi:hypothetical protein